MKDIIAIILVVAAVAYIMHLEHKLNDLKHRAVENLQLGLDIQRARDGWANKQQVANHYGGGMIEDSDFESWANSELRRRGMFMGYDLGIPDELE